MNWRIQSNITSKVYIKHHGESLMIMLLHSQSKPSYSPCPEVADVPCMYL